MKSNWQENSLFVKPTDITLAIDKNHEIVKLSDKLPWSDMILVAKNRREAVKLSCTGPLPRYRALLGGLTLIAIKNLTYREAEDQIANYAPARYLCDLVDSDWTPDHSTMSQFAKMIGPEGMQEINDLILTVAKVSGLSDPSHLMSDTTAQEARIPYPNEAGLMNRFMFLVGRNVKKLRGNFDGIKSKVAKAVEKTKGLLRNSHLFAKTKEQKVKIQKKMYHTVKEIQDGLAKIIKSGADLSSKAAQEVVKVNEVMKKLLPQIKHFLTTGFVAAKKIIHIQMPEIYAISRGKIGKATEFGLKWGISRVGGGFVSGFLMGEGKHANDTKFCRESLHQHIAQYGEVPRVFGFDRGGDSDFNIKAAKKLGVKHVGIAPRGKREWSVSPIMAERIRRERARVEGSIGTIKSSRYGFTKPRAHSKRAMVAYGHRAIFGFNAMKLVRMSENLVAA